MGLIYKNESDIFIQAGKSASIDNFQNAYGLLLSNDLTMAGSGTAPGIWLNPLYPGVDSEGYMKGQAVWINTEKLDDFTKAYMDDISSYASYDMRLRELFMSLSADYSGRVDLCRQIVEGYGDDPALYYLGDPAGRAQIMVSLSDYNTHPPTDLKWWKEFFIRYDEDDVNLSMDAAFASCVVSAFEDHLRNYHLSGAYSSSSQIESEFLKSDMTNATCIQRFQSHNWYTSSISGYDCVTRYELIQTSPGLFRWFRVWKSGMVEHGGIVDTTNIYDGDSYVDGVYTVNLGWNYAGGVAPVYDYSRSGFTGPYGEDSMYIAAGDTYSIISDDFDLKKRYTLFVSPASSSPYAAYDQTQRTYEGVETCFTENGGFSFIPRGNSTTYSYFVKGYSLKSRNY